jgi:hypothetical protein
VRRNTRFISVAIFAGLATVVGASLTWACTPATFGTPATPAAPPTPAAVVPGPPVATPPVAPTPSPATGVSVNAIPTPSASIGTSGAAATTGAPATGRNPIGSRARGNSGATSRSFGAGNSGGTNNQSRQAGTSFNQRANGDTVGTSGSNGRPVFGTSRAKAKAGAKGASAASPRSAAGDLWSGFRPAARSSVLAAQASPQKNGLGGTAIAALAMLGLGLAGTAGAMSFLALRSRRAKARPSAGGDGRAKM